MEKFSKTPLPLKDAFTFTMPSSADERGTFSKPASFELLSGMEFNTKEVFYSTSKKNVLRGMHYLHPAAQAKLVFCTHGRIWDVIVDLRRSSQTFKKWHAVELSAQNKTCIFVPKGFAHGFLSLEDDSTTFYITDEQHSQENDKGIRFDDPQLAIKWPLQGTPIISRRDLAFPFLKDASTYE